MAFCTALPKLKSTLSLNFTRLNLGATSFVDGAPPAGPGLYIAQYAQYYTANKFMDNSGNAIPLPGPDLDVWISLTQFIYMWDYDLGGGARPGLDVLIPVWRVCRWWSRRTHCSCRSERIFPSTATDAQLNGINVAGFRERAFGIGPGMLDSFSQKQHLFVNTYFEEDVRNRPEGFRLNLRYVLKY